jgi:hypothetical protein
MTDPTRCHYATDPATRPHCQLLAVLAYGRIALCASCDRQRSTLGKGLPRTPLKTTADLDVLAWIDQARRDLRTAEHALAGAVHRARQQGQSWSAIGTALHISRQAAQQRFGDPTRPVVIAGPSTSRRGPRQRPPERVDTPKGTAPWGIT